MSDTSKPADPAAATSTPGMLEHFFTAVGHGANLVYHRALAAEQNISAWTAGNPALAPLINEGVLFAKTVLAAHGVPVPAMLSTGEALVAALGRLAQADATVVSGRDGQ